MGSFDHASFRRFNSKIKFNYLDEAGKKMFFDRVLQPLFKTPINSQEISQLLKIRDLTPGDFKVVRQNILLNEERNHSIMEALVFLSEEVAFKRSGMTRHIGFS